MSLTLILGNQLFSDWTHNTPLRLEGDDEVIMIEDKRIATHFKYHKLRLLHTFVAMREFRDELQDKKVKVRYFELNESGNLDFFARIKKELGRSKKLRVADIVDRSFKKAVQDFCTKEGIQLEILPTPQFLGGVENFAEYMKRNKRPFMKTFYERERKRLKILVDAEGNPSGGQWSFDVENRKKLPKDYQEPKLPKIKPSTHEGAVRKVIEEYFSDHPGNMDDLYLPFRRKEAKEWLTNFLEVRLEDFGPYEDSISNRFEFVNHSLLAPLINLGLLNPDEVVQQALVIAKKLKTPIHSLEGFIRQIIGWREFLYGIDSIYGEKQKEMNFFNHQGQLAKSWYEGTTGIPPLDDAIKKVQKMAYLHHIERLMIVSNLMLLAEVHPQEVYRWFMEMHLDSYEWVMGPNVYGMGQMSDGGIFATKPYISGSNYILKMSDYSKGDWCEIWDGLYWSFIEKHKAFFLKNPRLSMMVKLLEKMPEARKKHLFKLAREFKEKNTV